jgi:threonine dehydrogenase-like Zn-dependent dehydrogenase
VWFVSEKRVEVREEKVRLRKNEILVRSALCGISHGTELLFFNNEIPDNLALDVSLPALQGRFHYPVKYGYINVGRAESGQKLFAFYPHQDVFALPRDAYVPFAEELSFEDAVFFAHMETALGIVQDASPSAGDCVAVFGQGAVGLLTAEILSRMLLSELISVEPIPKRRELSGAIGCTVLDSEDKNLTQKIHGLTEGRGVDCAINVSGSSTALQEAINAACFSGKIIEASWYGSRVSALNLGDAFHRKRLLIQGSQVSRIDPSLGGRWTKKRRASLVVELLHKILPSKYITHRFRLEEAQSAFELLNAHPEEVIEAVFVP